MSLVIKNKVVTVVGLGRSGVASAQLALCLGAKVKISDVASLEKVQSSLAGTGLENKLLIESGQHTKEFIQGSDLLVLSPGVRCDALPVVWAKEKKIPVLGEIEFAWRFCPCDVIAVTGSNGKTTTTTLVAEILKAAGRNVCLCGNIGSPFSQHVLSLKKNDVVALEVSSFQMETIETFKPRVAVFLNFSQNHLDRHKDLEEYFTAKARIFMNQTKDDFAVLNFDAPLHKDLAKKLSSKVLYYNDPGKCDASIANPNFLAAMTACSAFGVSAEIAKKVFAIFKGVEHRQEFVRTLDGVDYINDSKATTAESGAWALRRVARPIVMICGGHDKGTIDFSEVKALAKDKVKKMIVLTREEIVRKKLHDAFEGIVALEDHADMQQAILSARQQAEPGDKVLLSPMFASFDMFDNFEHRGKEFKRIVQQL